MIRITSRSLPGIVLEENRNRSPSFNTMPLYLPRANCALAARLSPWLPVTSSITFSRGRLETSSGPMTLGKPDRTPVSTEASIIRRMARPKRQIDRPARSPASARVFTRATLEAKVVATTILRASDTSFSTAGPTVASDRPACRENTLVESQTSALTPDLATSDHSAGSQGSPTSGVWSSLKSPVWMTRPAGESITNALDSGIECEIGRKPTLNGPTSRVSGHAEQVRTALPSTPYSASLPRAILAVKARA